MQPSDVFDLAERTSTYNTSDYATKSNDVSASTLRRRRVAVTNDINIQGKDRWFNVNDFLTDSDGCANRINYDFAKYELRVPIKQDTSPQADIESQGVGGTARLV